VTASGWMTDPMRKRFSVLESVQIGCGASGALLMGLKLTAHLCFVPRLTVHGVIPALHVPSWHNALIKTGTSFSYIKLVLYFCIYVWNVFLDSSVPYVMTACVALQYRDHTGYSCSF